MHYYTWLQTYLASSRERLTTVLRWSFSLLLLPLLPLLVEGIIWGRLCPAGTNGDVDLTNTVAEAANWLLLEGVAVASMVDGTDVETWVGVTCAVGAVVTWRGIGRMLAVGVVVTVGLMAAEGTVMVVEVDSATCGWTTRLRFLGFISSSNRSIFPSSSRV